MSIVESLNKRKEGKSSVEIVSGATKGKNFDVIRIQLEGMAGSGKSNFILQIIKHMHEKMGIALKDILVCLIDCDEEGIAPLLFSQVIPIEYQECIKYAKCDDIWMVNDAYRIFDEMLIKHREETGQDGWLIFENMGKLWYFCQRDYVQATMGMEYVELLIERQEEAYARGKKTLPVFDQMLDYRNINPLHNELANKAARKKYNLLWTAHPMTRTFQEGDEEVEKVVGAGQKGNDARVDFILRMYNLKGRWYADSRKLRSLDNNFVKLPLPENSFEAFIDKYHDMLKSYCKKGNKKLPEFKWVRKSNDKPSTKKVDKPKNAPKSKSAPKPIDDDDDEGFEL